MGHEDRLKMGRAGKIEKKWEKRMGRRYSSWAARFMGRN
jgi:hypothetical protein